MLLAENLASFSELAGHRYDDTELRHLPGEAGLQEARVRRASAYPKGMRLKVRLAT